MAPEAKPEIIQAPKNIQASINGTLNQTGSCFRN